MNQGRSATKQQRFRLKQEKNEFIKAVSSMTAKNVLSRVEPDGRQPFVSPVGWFGNEKVFN